MSLSRPVLDLARLEDATRVLLSPLVSPDSEAWRREAVRATRELMGADHALFAHSTEARRHLGEADDDPMAATYDALISTVDGQFFNPADRLSESWLRSHRASGRGVFTWDEIDCFVQEHGYSLRDSVTTNEVLLAHRGHDLRGFVVSVGDAEAALQFTNDRPGAPSVGEAARPLLRALLPSFRAGLDALHTLRAHRLTLDAVAGPLVVLDADGRERHRNTALGVLLDADPERTTVEHTLWQLGRDLRRLAFPRRRETGPAPVVPMQRVAQTAAARYTLSATLLPTGAFGPGETALVTVHAVATPRPADPAAVAARTGLSVREAEVALLVADGLSNAAIAERLFVAPGTVKRHVENVLAKLGAPSRGGVAARLAGPPP